MARWSKEQILYMKHLNMHPNERQYKSDKELSEALGVHFNTLLNWRKLPGWAAAVKKAAWLVMEDMNPVALMQARILVRQTDNLKDLADYFRFIFPLMEMARMKNDESGESYLSELETTNRGAYLPQEVVQRELDKLPLPTQKLFVDFITRLDYLKEQQAVVDLDAPDEVDLYKPVEDIKPVIVNVSSRKRKWMDELPAPESAPARREKRHYSGSRSEAEIEL